MTARSDVYTAGGERSQVLQVAPSAAAMGLATSIPASGSVQSNVLLSNGYLAFALGLTSSQAGQVSIQRFIDAAGTVAQGAAITASLTAATAAVANVSNDGKPFQSIQITVTNTGGSTATLTAIAALWQSAT